MCVAQVAPLKAAFPSSSSTTGTVYPQCRWVNTKAPLKQVAHIQNGRLLPTQRRLLPIPVYQRRDIVGHAVGAENGSLWTLWCWVSPANSSSSHAHENKIKQLIKRGEKCLGFKCLGFKFLGFKFLGLKISGIQVSGIQVFAVKVDHIYMRVC